MAGLLLTEQQRFDWLRLMRTEGVGPRTFRSLINRFGGAGAALAALPGLARAAGRPVALPADAAIERELAMMDRLGCRLVALGEGGYPAALASTHMAPPLLAVRGDLAILSRPMVAIVGSRNASALGAKFAERLAAELSEAGIAVVSGLARGIDAAAHRASLKGGTVAVLAGGHGRIYPPQHADLVEALVESGAALSESPFEMEPRGRDFPRRNRIVAGLALATVVVEAARKSGSLITARMALDEGRELFAVPGSPLDPRAEGTNDLLHGVADGARARMCRSAEDVLAEIRPMIEGGALPSQGELLDGGGEPSGIPPLFDEFDWLVAEEGRSYRPHPAARREDELTAAEPEPAHFDPAERVYDLLGASPLDVDDLVRHGALQARQVKSALLDLELSGRVRRDPSGGYCRA